MPVWPNSKDMIIIGVSSVPVVNIASGGPVEIGGSTVSLKFSGNLCANHQNYPTSEFPTTINKRTTRPSLPLYPDLIRALHRPSLHPSL